MWSCAIQYISRAYAGISLLSWIRAVWYNGKLSSVGSCVGDGLSAIVEGQSFLYIPQKYYAGLIDARVTYSAILPGARN